MTAAREAALRVEAQTEAARYRACLTDVYRQLELGGAE